MLRHRVRCEWWRMGGVIGGDECGGCVDAVAGGGATVVGTVSCGGY